MRVYPRPVVSWLLALISFVCCPGCSAADAPASALGTPGGAFLVKPYLQMGDFPAGQGRENLALLWQTEDADAEWGVEYRPASGQNWKKTEPPSMRRIAVTSIPPHRLYRASVTGLPAGEKFAYRVRKGSEVVFSAEGRARKAAGQPYRFAVFGDCGSGTAQQRAVAFQVHQASPDFVVITGDVVYSRGRVSEYRERFWPVYNADQASGSVGAPLLRSTLFMVAPGNHDLASKDLGQYPDGLAYFLYWDQPLNGMSGAELGPRTRPLAGPETNRKAFLDSAGGTFPRMANFSFDYGNAHWTVIDSTLDLNGNDREIRDWVARDLASAQKAAWRFVAFHHPGFNSSRSHFDDQRTRVLSDVFESGGVDVVFSGHVHNYQRTLPLRFVPRKGADGNFVSNKGRVEGRWTLDRTFDGRKSTRPAGVIYLVTGAGGAKLYNPEQQDDPASWQEFTHRFVSKVHSFTVADVDGSTLTVRQVSAEGEELDQFTITK